MASEFYIAGIGGMIGGLLWRSILPYILERQKAEQEGREPPSFEKTYMATMIISVIGGLVALFMAIETFEKTILTAQSGMMAAGIGFAFTYTILGVGNDYVDLKKTKTTLTREVAALKQEKADRQIPETKELG